MLSSQTRGDRMIGMDAAPQSDGLKRLCAGPPLRRPVAAAQVGSGSKGGFYSNPRGSERHGRGTGPNATMGVWRTDHTRTPTR